MGDGRLGGGGGRGSLELWNLNPGGVVMWEESENETCTQRDEKQTKHFNCRQLSVEYKKYVESLTYLIV